MIALLYQLPWQQNDQTHALLDRLSPSCSVCMGHWSSLFAVVTLYRFVYKLKIEFRTFNSVILVIYSLICAVSMATVWLDIIPVGLGNI